MAKVTYKVLDDKGRITIPLEMRNGAKIFPGDVIKVSWKGDKNEIVLSGVEVFDFEKEDPEIIEACIYAAVRNLTKEKKVALAASLLSPMAGGERR